MKLRTISILALVLTAALASGVLANLQPGTKAPDFSLPTLDGKTFSLSGYLKTQPSVIVLDICATWCGPCRGEIPYLTNLSTTMKGSATVVGVFIDNQRGPVADFVKSQKVPYVVALDPNGAKIAALYDVKGIPATYIIDKKGVVRYAHTGFPSGSAEQQREAAMYEQEIKTLLAEK